MRLERVDTGTATPGQTRRRSILTCHDHVLRQLAAPMDLPGHLLSFELSKTYFRLWKSDDSAHQNQKRENLTSAMTSAFTTSTRGKSSLTIKSAPTHKSHHQTDTELDSKTFVLARYRQTLIQFWQTLVSGTRTVGD